MTIEQLASLGKIEAMKKRARYDDPLPAWVYQQRYRYPQHDQHSQLIDAYKKAAEKHAWQVEVLQSAFKRRCQKGYQETVQTAKSLEDCKQQEQEAKEGLNQAVVALQTFNNHTPEERIAVYEAEIAQFEIELMEAHASEHAFTEKMLNDPNAARARLDRMLQGRTGDKAEYSQQDLSELRCLKNVVESLKSKIWKHQRDIQNIRELVSEEERKAAVKAIMDEVLPRFDDACAKFEQALSDLIDAASEHDVRVNAQNLKIPKQAIFREGTYYHGQSTISIEF